MDLVRKETPGSLSFHLSYSYLSSSFRTNCSSTPRSHAGRTIWFHQRRRSHTGKGGRVFNMCSSTVRFRSLALSLCETLWLTGRGFKEILVLFGGRGFNDISLLAVTSDEARVDAKERGLRPPENNDLLHGRNEGMISTVTFLDAAGRGLIDVLVRVIRPGLFRLYGKSISERLPGKNEGILPCSSMFPAIGGGGGDNLRWLSTGGVSQLAMVRAILIHVSFVGCE